MHAVETAIKVYFAKCAAHWYRTTGSVTKRGGGSAAVLPWAVMSVIGVHIVEQKESCSNAVGFHSNTV